MLVKREAEVDRRTVDNGAKPTPATTMQTSKPYLLASLTPYGHVENSGQQNAETSGV